MLEARAFVGSLGLVLATLVGCGGGSDSGAHPDAPDIVSFTTSVQPLLEGGSVTFTAAVTDPQGPSNILTGMLKGTTIASYGSFVAGASGAFTLTVDWAAIQGVHSINGDRNGEMREFVAEFIDLEGHKGTETLTLTLACNGSTPAAPCAGVCKNVETDPFNCGGCNLRCPNATPDPLSPHSYCRNLLCQEVYLRFSERINCDMACSARGGKCDHDNANCPGQQCDLHEQSFAVYSGGIMAPLSGCGTVPEPIVNSAAFVELGCNCKDLPGT